MKKEKKLIKKEEKIIKKEKKSMNKKQWAYGIIAIAIIITLAISVYVYNLDNVDKTKRTSDINSYKKNLYETVICQYSCPLKLQDYQNKTQLLPDFNCVADCTKNFKSKFSTETLNNLNFTKEELARDNFFNDIETIVENCKTTSVDSYSGMNNSKFFSCSIQGLKQIKENYSYLMKIN